MLWSDDQMTFKVWVVIILEIVTAQQQTKHSEGPTRLALRNQCRERGVFPWGWFYLITVRDPEGFLLENRVNTYFDMLHGNITNVIHIFKSHTYRDFKSVAISVILN